MPLYTYLCPKCRKEQDAYRSVANRKRGPKCCGKSTSQVLTFGHVTPMFEPYRAVGLPGRPYIKTRAEHKAQLREHGREEVGNDSSMRPEMEATDAEWSKHQSERRKQIQSDIAKSAELIAALNR